MSRESILQKVEAAQPGGHPLPEMPGFSQWFDDPLKKFTEVTTAIGSAVHLAESYAQVSAMIRAEFADARKMVSKVTALADLTGPWISVSPHEYEDVDLFIIEPQLAVAESGAVWVTDLELEERVLPFIAQHLVAIVRRNTIVATMHDAYARIGNEEYGFAAFIAGPSKTADIEQSLVLGAHGPKSMTIFLM